jgi:hypothetical protein
MVTQTNSSCVDYLCSCHFQDWKLVNSFNQFFLISNKESVFHLFMVQLVRLMSGLLNEAVFRFEVDSGVSRVFWTRENHRWYKGGYLADEKQLERFFRNHIKINSGEHHEWWLTVQPCLWWLSQGLALRHLWPWAAQVLSSFLTLPSIRCMSLSKNFLRLSIIKADREY